MTWNLALIVFPLLALAAGLSDVLTYRIPNPITAAIAVLVVPAALFFAMPLDVALWHLVAAVCVLVAGFALFAFGVIGGGDAKLIAASTLWIGPAALLPFVVNTALCGGALAVIYFAWSAIQFHFDATHHDCDTSVIKRIAAYKRNLPYGAAIAIGACVAFPQTWWFSGATTLA